MEPVIAAEGLMPRTMPVLLRAALASYLLAAFTAWLRGWHASSISRCRVVSTATCAAALAAFFPSATWLAILYAGLAPRACLPFPPGGDQSDASAKKSSKTAPWVSTAATAGCRLEPNDQLEARGTTPTFIRADQVEQDAEGVAFVTFEIMKRLVGVSSLKPLAALVPRPSRPRSDALTALGVLKSKIKVHTLLVYDPVLKRTEPKQVYLINFGDPDAVSKARSVNGTEVTIEEVASAELCFSAVREHFLDTPQATGGSPGASLWATFAGAPRRGFGNGLSQVISALSEVDFDAATYRRPREGVIEIIGTVPAAKRHHFLRVSGSKGGIFVRDVFRDPDLEDGAPAPRAADCRVEWSNLSSLEAARQKFATCSGFLGFVPGINSIGVRHTLDATEAVRRLLHPADPRYDDTNYGLVVNRYYEVRGFPPMTKATAVIKAFADVGVVVLPIVSWTVPVPNRGRDLIWKIGVRSAPDNLLIPLAGRATPLLLHEITDEDAKARRARLKRASVTPPRSTSRAADGAAKPRAPGRARSQPPNAAAAPATAVPSDAPRGSLSADLSKQPWTADNDAWAHARTAAVPGNKAAPAASSRSPPLALGKDVEMLHATVSKLSNRVAALESGSDSLCAEVKAVSGKFEELSQNVDSRIAEAGRSFEQRLTQALSAQTEQLLAAMRAQGGAAPAVVPAVVPPPSRGQTRQAEQAPEMLQAEAQAEAQRAMAVDVEALGQGR